MEELYGRFINSTLLEGPCTLPNVFVKENGDTVLGFNLLKDSNPELLIANDWYLIDNNSINIIPNTDYESVIYSSWYLENNILKRENILLPHSFEVALTIAFNKLNNNRETYEISGFDYSYNGIPVKILTDKEDSQYKLTSAILSANNGTRLDTDTWKFIKKSDNSTLVFQVPNTDLITIGNFVFRNIQDSYNLTSQIAWQMLGTEDTITLRYQIENNFINLNPWGV